MSNTLICIVGMGGAGKSATADYIRSKLPHEFLRFGQLTLDKIREMGLEPSEALEKQIREGLREEYGMAAYAILNLPKIEELLKKGNVIGDGLYSWGEYLVLKEHFGARMKVLSVFAPPAMRYKRLSERSKGHGEDKEKRFRSFTHDEAASRDKSEIEKSDKGGPIAMADYTLINTSKLEDLYKQIDMVLKEIY